MRDPRPECRPGDVHASPESPMNPLRPYRRMAVAALALLALAACQTTPEAPPGTPGAPRTQAHKATPGVPAPLADVAARAADPEAKGDPYRIFKGTGIVVKGQQPGGGVPPAPAAPPSGGGVVLNFEGADLREVVRNILGDILGESYTIDPAVGGQVTIRTTSGVPRDALYATLETILRMNGATMVKAGGLFKIVPQAAAVRGNVTPQLGSSQRALPAGYSVQIVPLRYVGVRDMIRILEPFAKDAQAVRADELRNLLILAGTERELRHLIETVDMFDIDWMAGMSAGVFVLQNADVKSVMGELDKVIGNPQQSPLAGLLRIVPIERMNALLVISPNPAYLEQAKQWVERLDRGGGGDGPRLYVYAMQNSRAEKVAPLLQQAFTGRAQARGRGAAADAGAGYAGRHDRLAASIPAAVAAAADHAGTGGGRGGRRPRSRASRRCGGGPRDRRGHRHRAQPAGRRRQGQQHDHHRRHARRVRGDRVGAEEARRAGAPGADRHDDRRDRPQRRVEVRRRVAVQRRAAERSRRSAASSTPRSLRRRGTARPARRRCRVRSSQGFTYLISSAKFPGGIQAALRLLDTYGNTKVISNPHLAALDNQKATIKVGERIPINQQNIVGGIDNVISTTSQYIDTGVLVQVTPHINAGGLVTLEVQAEVSNPGQRCEGRRRAADQHAVGTDEHRGADRPDDDHGRADPRRRPEQLRGPAAGFAHSDPRRAVRQPDAQEEPHRARALRDAAGRGHRVRRPGRRRRPAPPHGAPGQRVSGSRAGRGARGAAGLARICRSAVTTALLRDRNIFGVPGKSPESSLTLPGAASSLESRTAATSCRPMAGSQRSGARIKLVGKRGIAWWFAVFGSFWIFLSPNGDR